MTRRSVSTSTPWEAIAGYSRALRAGNQVHISGTTATDEHGAVHGTDAAAQTRYILTKIEAALHAVGASLPDVVRTRIYIINKDDWQAVARVHGEVFSAIRPANTLVQVAGLIGGGIVEIEADATVSVQPTGAACAIDP